MNQEFEADQLALRQSHPQLPQLPLEPPISLSPEPENPPTHVPVDTRPIWPGRIELIY